jgi:hypothetical protein
MDFLLCLLWFGIGGTVTLAIAGVCAGGVWLLENVVFEWLDRR